MRNPNKGSLLISSIDIKCCTANGTINSTKLIYIYIYYKNNKIKPNYYM